MRISCGLLTIFFISYVIDNEVSCRSEKEKEAESIEEIEQNTIVLACLYISKHYIKSSKKDTETSFAELNLSQDKLYLKLLVLTFNYCKNTMKFEETSEIIDAWMENRGIEIIKYNELMNPELHYDDIYQAFELSESDKETLQEIDEIERVFKNYDEKLKNKRIETLKLLEENFFEENFNYNKLLGQNLWKVLYVFLICLIISGCFILLFTGFSISGKLEGLEKEEEILIEGNDNNLINNKRGNEKK